MSFNNHYRLACMISLGFVVGYSPTSAAASHDAHASMASFAAMSSPVQPGDDDSDPPITHIECARIFSPADVAGILHGHITIGVYDMRDNACHFESDDGGSFNLYSGDGFTDQLEFKQAAANRNGEYRALTGVGDEAYFRGNREFMSRKGGYYCAISGSGGNPASEALAQKFGRLCNKIFAIH